jgi:hypothetical protein
MAWTKPLGTVTAEAADEDLQMSFYYSDASATPPNALRVQLNIKNDGGSGTARENESVDSLLSAAGLTAGEQTTLKGLLKKIRDAGLASLGYAES